MRAPRNYFARSSQRERHALRVADSLYWMSRYLERAEHTARVVEVKLNLMLERKPGSRRPALEVMLKSLAIEMPAVKEGGWIARGC